MSPALIEFIDLSKPTLIVISFEVPSWAFHLPSIYLADYYTNSDQDGLVAVCRSHKSISMSPWPPCSHFMCVLICGLCSV